MAHMDRDKSDLIPDYCNDRLNAQEKADFERLLREDRELADECEDFQDFRKLYRRMDPAEPLPSDAIFDRISRKVGTQQQVEKSAPVQSSPLAAIRRFWQRLRESVAVPWMLAAAQAAVIVLLLIPAPEQKSTYSTLSATEGAANTGKAGINVVFRPDAPESEIRSLLQNIEGSISSGPSREGRYVVSIGNRSELDKAVQTLKQSKIVVFAEPVYQ